MRTYVVAAVIEKDRILVDVLFLDLREANINLPSSSIRGLLASFLRFTCHSKSTITYPSFEINDVNNTPLPDPSSKV